MKALHKVAAAVAVAAGTGLLVASPASAAPGGTIDDIRQEGCELIATITVEDAGTYFLNTWDDGNFRSGVEFTAALGETVEVTIVVENAILQGAAGLGVYLEDGLGPAATTTYDSDGSYAGADAVGPACEASGGVDSGLPPEVSISPATGSVTEGAVAELVITRSFPGFARTVNFTVSGTAVAGDDFTALPASIVIPEGARTVVLPITALDDGVVEADRTVVVVLAGPAQGDNFPYTLGTEITAAVTIVDPAQVPETTTTTTTTTPPTAPPPVVAEPTFTG